LFRGPLRQLSDEQKTHLQGRFLVSTGQAEELDRRIAAYEKNQATGTPCEQVKAGLPKR
jgi:hypothetical protein